MVNSIKIPTNRPPLPPPPPFPTHTYTLGFFYIRTSNFGGGSYLFFFFLRFVAENVLKMFLNYMVYTTGISVNQ